MTTTSVTVKLSDYDIGIRHVYFDGHDSTSTVGSFWSDGWCEWHVFYPDSTTADESYAGTKDFSYVCTLPGTYTFKYRATDRGGNHGSWVETTVTVQDESLASYTQYVDTAAGNDANTGESTSEPVQTLHQAEINLKAGWVTDGTHVIYVKRGQTATNSPPWSGHTAAGRVMFRPWGAGVSRAVVGNSFGSTTCGTGQTSIVFWDVDLECGDNGGIDLDGGFGRTVPYDFIAKDCLMTNTISGFWPRNIVEADAGERSGTDRDNDVFSLVAFEGVTVRAPDALFAFFGFSYATKIHFVDVWVDGLKVDGTSHSMRLWNVRNVYMRDCLWDAQAPTGNDIRFPTYEGAGSADATERITAHNCTIIGGQAYSHEAENALYYVRDVTFVGCQGMFSARKALGGYGGAWDADRIVSRNCYGHHDTIPFDLHATLGNVGSYLYEGCMRVRGFGGYSIFSFNGALSRYTGTLKFRNNIWYWEVDANPAPQIVFEANLSDSDLDAILDGDYNVAASVDANAITWVSSTSGSSSLATWVSTSGQESHSAAATSETLPITTLPGDAWDPRLTGTGGYLADKGLDDTYSLDIDGKIRVGDYPGPDDPEASTSPDVPTLGGGGGPAPESTGMPVRLSLNLGLGL